MQKKKYREQEDNLSSWQESFQHRKSAVKCNFVFFFFFFWLCIII